MAPFGRLPTTLLNEIRSTPKVITPLKGINEAMLFTDAGTAEQFVARLPHGTLELVPGAGHAPWIDEIKKATASTRTFLAG